MVAIFADKVSSESVPLSEDFQVLVQSAKASRLAFAQSNTFRKMVGSLITSKLPIGFDSNQVEFDIGQVQKACSWHSYSKNDIRKFMSVMDDESLFGAEYLIELPSSDDFEIYAYQSFGLYVTRVRSYKHSTMTCIGTHPGAIRASWQGFLPSAE